MDRGVEIFLYILFIVVAIVSIVAILTWLRPVAKTVQVNDNTLQNNFDKGDGNINMFQLVKPFPVMAGARANDVRQAVVYSDLGSTAIIFPTQPAVMANQFTVTDYMRVVSLQIFADLLDYSNAQVTSRTVGIYNADTTALLVQANVDIGDALISGFRTHFLTPATYVDLTPNVNYVIVSVNLPGDKYAPLNDIAQPVLELKLGGQCIVRGSSSLLLPNRDQFTPAINNLLFASFQIQRQDTINQTAFSVDLATGLATFPVRYAFNLNTYVIDANQCVIEEGFCINSKNDTNMHNPTRLIVSGTILGVGGLDTGSLKPSTWYACYLINSTLQNLPPAGLLSLNFQDPDVVPIAYDTWRRVGWARTDASTNFIPTFQTGNGARRTTTYNTPQQVFFHIYTLVDMGNPPLFYNVPLELVSPPGSSAQITIATNNGNSSSLFMLIRDDIFHILQYTLTVPLGINTQHVNIVVPPQPIPHGFELALQPVLSIGSTIPTTVSVIAFEDDI